MTTTISPSTAPHDVARRPTSPAHLEDCYCPDVPALNYEPCRWATLRNQNVEQMAGYWGEDPSRAFVLTDSKFNGNDLVVLSKHVLDQILTPLRELTAGRAALRIDIRLIAANVSALKNVLHVLSQTLDSSKEPVSASALQAAFENLNALEVQMSKVTASVVVPNPLETPYADLDDDERELAREILEEEESME